MKKIYLVSITLLLMTTLLFGCGSKVDVVEPDPADKVYPLTIEGVEVIVGETSVGKMLDAGLQITVTTKEGDLDYTVHGVNPDQALEANTYYSGGTLRTEEMVYGKISLATLEAVPMRDAVIANLEIDVNNVDASKVTFAGMPLNEVTKEKAYEVIEGSEGDDYMVLHYGKNYKVLLSFDPSGKLMTLSMQKVYDVDWSNEN